MHSPVIYDMFAPSCIGSLSPHGTSPRRRASNNIQPPELQSIVVSHRQRRWFTLMELIGILARAPGGQMRGAATQAMSVCIVEERQRRRCPPAAAPLWLRPAGQLTLTKTWGWDWSKGAKPTSHQLRDWRREPPGLLPPAHWAYRASGCRLSQSPAPRDEQSHPPCSRMCKAP